MLWSQSKHGCRRVCHRTTSLPKNICMSGHPYPRVNGLPCFCTAAPNREGPMCRPCEHQYPDMHRPITRKILPNITPHTAVLLPSHAQHLVTLKISRSETPKETITDTKIYTSSLQNARIRFRRGVYIVYVYLYFTRGVYIVIYYSLRGACTTTGVGAVVTSSVRQSGSCCRSNARGPCPEHTGDESCRWRVGSISSEHMGATCWKPNTLATVKHTSASRTCMSCKTRAHHTR
jgi:hypothetical protein